MKCPHCEYEHDEGMAGIHFDGGEGDFFESCLKFTRESGAFPYRKKETEKLLACPKCRKTFITSMYS